MCVPKTICACRRRSRPFHASIGIHGLIGRRVCSDGVQLRGRQPHQSKLGLTSL